MSSSPQISGQDGISNSLPSFSKIHASSVGPSVSSRPSTSAYSAYKLPAQEETVFQKETVRISPPLHQKEIPVSTYHTNGNIRNSRYVTCRQSQLSEEKTFLLGHISEKKKTDSVELDCKSCKIDLLLFGLEMSGIVNSQSVSLEF